VLELRGIDFEASRQSSTEKLRSNKNIKKKKKRKKKKKKKKKKGINKKEKREIYQNKN